MYIDVVESGIEVLPYCREVCLNVGPATDSPRSHGHLLGKCSVTFSK
jgi:hypothetical protein